MTIVSTTFVCCRNHESTDLSAEESVEQIDNEEILIFNLTPADKTFASLPSDIRSFVNSKRRGRFRCSNSLCAADPVEFFSI